MKLLPDTMFGRLFMAVCVPIVAMLAITIALVIYDRQVLARQLGGSNDTIERIVSMVPELGKLELAERSAAMSRVNAAPLLDTAGSSGAAARDSELRASARALAQVDGTYVRPLARRLGADCRVVATRAAPWATDYVDLARTAALNDEFSTEESLPEELAAREWLGRRLYDLAVSCGEHSPVLFRVVAPQEPLGLNRQLAVTLVLLACALAVALFYTTRRLTQPLTRLHQVAEAIGRSVTLPKLEETGAREVRESLRAFNTMQDRLRRYLDSRTRVLAAMSHDLRTPLTRLRLRAESLDDSVARDRLVADIEEMDALVSRSLGLFRGLNDDESAVPTDLNQLIAGLVSEFRELGHEVPVSGVVRSPAVVRPQALKRALRNLVENAIKYGERASIAMEDGSEIRLMVRDSGPGIPLDQMSAMFEPFRRLETSRNRDTGGIGLGMTIAHDIAELHGGRLQLSNRREGGLEAALILPR